MSFMLFCYSADRVEIATDNGHRFAFNVIPAEGRRQITLGVASWNGGEQPADSVDVLRDAKHFAQRCAQDCGLA